MKKEIAQKWIAALRSGDYAQTRGALCRLNDSEFSPPSFCCLGVLCEISGVKKRKREAEFYPIRYGAAETFEILPVEVMEWAGMATNLGTLSDGTTLSSRNDHGHNFEQIADLIEKHWETL